MSIKGSVISAFLDGERFSANDLEEALSEQAGRELLVDLLALRHIVQPHNAETSALPVPRAARSAMRPALVAAAVIVALVGGYVAGQRRDGATLPEAPTASRVIEVAGAWQDVPQGSRR